MKKIKYTTKHRLLRHPAVTVASYFVFQGMRYMTRGERAFKLSITATLGLLAYYLGAHPGVALIAGHTGNLLMNGQLPVLMRYVIGDVGLTMNRAHRALDKIRSTAPRFGVTEALFYGSFSRHSMTASSDIDIRFCHAPGFTSSLSAYAYAMYMRLWATYNFIPLDVYCFSSPSFLLRMRADENPAILFREPGLLALYPTATDAYTTLKANLGLR